MSERLLALLLTLGFFLLVALWIPFLDMIVRIARRRRQAHRMRLLRKELESDLPGLYANPESRKASAHAR